MIGRTLSHYEILEKLGSGGMGDVYLAEDTKLDRKVALKVLPPDLAENEERRARFQREAKAIAALDHPNIVQVFSVEEADGTHFITMQLVRGRTLTELLPKNGFPLNKFFDIAIPLTDAVAAAHQEGITHRDLKPDNIMVTDDGRVKVLDFGLAKLASGFVGGADSALPTAAKTAEGAIVGTLRYMAPEQAQGEKVDERADIFSLGIVFYQMVTGQRPFRGNNPASLLSSIIKDTPRPVTDLKPTLPRDLARITKRCLAKEPVRRYQSAIDVRNALEETKQDLESGELADSSSGHNLTPAVKWFAVATGALAATLAGALAYVLHTSSDSSLRLTNPVQVTSAVGVEDFPSWSPDGSRLAFQSSETGGDDDIWIVQLGGGGAVNRTMDRVRDDQNPRWSPDGSQIAFVSGTDVFLIPAVGGSARKVYSPDIASNVSSAMWSSDGEELAVSFRSVDTEEYFIDVFALRSQQSRRIPLPRECSNARWSPGGEYFACVEIGIRRSDFTKLWLMPASGGEPIEVTDGTSSDRSPVWSPSGSHLYFVSNRGGGMDLWRVRVGRNGRIGEPVPLTAGVGMRRVALSPDGRRLAYSRGQNVANVWRVPILKGRLATWDDADQITHDQAYVRYLDASPDGKNLVISSNRFGNQDLWMLPLAGGEMTQLTTDPTPDLMPNWSPDGTQIAFTAYRSGNADVWVLPVGGGPARQVTSHPELDINPRWSPDGREITFRSNRTGDARIWVAPAAAGGEPRQVTSREPGEQMLPAWLRDGEWLHFSGNRRLWRVRASGGESEPVTKDTAEVSISAPDGDWGYFVRSADNNIWTVSLKGGNEHPMTDLSGRPGNLHWATLATDGEYLYFIWEEDTGDIWVMDVATDESE